MWYVRVLGFADVLSRMHSFSKLGVPFLRNPPNFLQPKLGSSSYSETDNIYGPRLCTVAVVAVPTLGASVYSDIYGPVWF